jgi:hypothetical protein
MIYKLICKTCHHEKNTKKPEDCYCENCGNEMEMVNYWENNK